MMLIGDRLIVNATNQAEPTADSPDVGVSNNLGITVDVVDAPGVPDGGLGINGEGKAKVDAIIHYGVAGAMATLEFLEVNTFGGNDTITVDVPDPMLFAPTSDDSPPALPEITLDAGDPMADLARE